MARDKGKRSVKGAIVKVPFKDDLCIVHALVLDEVERHVNKDICRARVGGSERARNPRDTVVENNGGKFTRKDSQATGRIHRVSVTNSDMVPRFESVFLFDRTRRFHPEIHTDFPKFRSSSRTS